MQRTPGCLAGHVMNMIADNGFWHSNHTIPCSLYPQACNDAAVPHKAIRKCLGDADEHETLKDYMKLWHEEFGNAQKMQRMKNVSVDWIDVGGDRSEAFLQQLDEAAASIGEALALGNGFETRYAAWEADLTEAERCVCICECVKVLILFKC